MTTRRVVFGLLIGVGLLAVLAAGVIWWAFSTEAGAKRVIAYGLGKSPVGLVIDDMRGPLRGPLLLLGVRYRSGGLSAEVDTVLLDVRLRPLLRGRVQFDRLHAAGMRVIIPDSAPRDTAGTARARRESPQPPFPVILGEVLVRRFEVDGPRNTSLRDGALHLSGTLEDYRFDIAGTAFLPEVDTVFMKLAGRGNLVGVALDSSTTRLLEGRVAATGQIQWWPRLEWDLALDARELNVAHLLTDPSQLPGFVSLRAKTTGAIESKGPAGLVVVDSIGGMVRGQPVRGRGEARFARLEIGLANFDVGWGSARIRAQGAIGDSLAVTYTVDVGNLATVMSRARGSISVTGSAHGPRATPRLRARALGRRLALTGARMQRLSARADLNLAPGGRLTLDLQGDSAQVATQSVERATLALRGTQGRHRLTADLVADVDTVHLAVAGGLRRGTWTGQIGELTVKSTLDDWHLEQPAALSASARAVRLDSLCVASDSAGGRICAEGAWRRASTWNALVSVDSLALARTPFLTDLGVLPGVLHARGEARTTGTGAAASLEARVNDDGRDAAVLTGNATWPGYRPGRSLTLESMDARLNGRIENLALLEPLVGDPDSLRGTATLEAAVTGSLGSPHVNGALRLDQFAIGLSRNRTAQGSLEVGADLTVHSDRSLSGEVHLTPHGVELSYRGIRRSARLSFAGEGITIQGDGNGVRSRLDLRVSSEARDTIPGDSVASVTGEVVLPEYRLGAALGPQPVTFRLGIAIANLGSAQPLLTPLDSLQGRVALEVEGQGRVGMPNVTGTLRVDSASALLPSGTMVRGGLSGDLRMAVASDSTISGSLRLEPHDVTLVPAYREASVVHLRGTGLEAQAGADGVRIALDAAVAAEGDTSLATFRGRAALPRFTRMGRSLAPQPVEATLEGRVDDFGFLPAFTAQIDSAAGRMTLDARLTGTVGESRLAGEAVLSDVALRLPLLGVLFQDLQLTAKGDQEGAITLDGRLRSGGGELSIKGSTPVQPTSEEPGRFEIRGDRFEVANNSIVRAIISPRLDVRIAGDSLGVVGEVEVPLARVQIHEMPTSAIAPSDDVILLDSLEAPRRERPITAQVRVALGDTVSIQAFNFNAELGGAVVLRQEPDQLPTATGSLVIEEGLYRAYGQDLRIENGFIRFAGGSVDNPGLSIRATRTVSDTMVVGITIAGTLKEPDVQLFSEPPLSPSQTLSYLVTGAPVIGGAGSSGNLLERALSTLGLMGGTALGRRAGSQVGLDEVGIRTRGDLQDASLVIGRYFSPKLYVSYGIGLFDPVSTLRLRYVLSNRFTLQAETGAEMSADAIVRLKKGKGGQ